MAKHVSDVNEDRLVRARTELGTDTLNDTVDDARRPIADGRTKRVAEALDLLAAAPRDDRRDSWR